MVNKVRAGSAVVLLLVAAGAWWGFGRQPAEEEAPTTSRARPRSGRTRVGAGVLEPIALTRLETPRPDAEVGKRDLFDFGRAAAPEPPPRPVATPRTPAPPGPATSPTPAPRPGARSQAQRLPPADVAFIGSLEREGLKVAVLLLDNKQVLTGQVGQVLGNRVRVVSIGIESVDIQHVGSDEVRRIPLEGNED